MKEMYNLVTKICQKANKCLDEAMIDALQKCGFTKDYYNTRNEEFSTLVSPLWPYAIDYLKNCLDLPISRKYCVYHLGKPLFEIDEIYKYKDEANKNGLYFECNTKFYDEQMIRGHRSSIWPFEDALVDSDIVNEIVKPIEVDLK